MRRHGGQVDDAGRDDHIDRQPAQRAQQGLQSPDPSAFARRGQKRHREIVVRQGAHRRQRQPVTRWSDDEIERRGALQDRSEGRGIGKHVGGRERPLEEHTPVVEADDIERDGSGVDTDHPGHRMQWTGRSASTSASWRARRWFRRPAPGRCARTAWRCTPCAPSSSACRRRAPRTRSRRRARRRRP
jgi:hypothetical protein